MLYVEDFLNRNGHSQRLLNNNSYIFHLTVTFNDGNFDSNVQIENIDLRGIDITDAITIVDLVARLFYIQWKEQYKNRSYFEPKNNQEYQADIKVEGLNYNISSIKGFGSYLTPEQKNTILLVLALSIKKYIEQNTDLEVNAFRSQLIYLLDNLDSYIDNSLFSTPDKFINNVISKFFNLDGYSLESPKEDIHDNSKELFTSYVQNNRDDLTKNIQSRNTFSTDVNREINPIDSLLFFALPGALVIAVGFMDYSYYIFLRFFVSISSIYLILRIIQLRKNVSTFNMLILILILLLFNPVVPVYATREFWVILDLLSAIYFAYLIFKIR